MFKYNAIFILIIQNTIIIICINECLEVFYPKLKKINNLLPYVRFLKH